MSGTSLDMDRLVPEKTTLTLGFVALLDSAPLVVAREQGFFAEQGLEVRLQRENSWASVRDKVAYGLLDGAQMIAPMPLASSLGLGAPPVPMETALVMSRNGNAITLATALADAAGIEPDELGPDPLLSGRLLRAHLTGLERPLKLATVYPYSCHHYQLRYWLNVSGISPRQVEFIGAPPRQMVDLLKSGQIDGCCVGEPWNSLAEVYGVGRVVATGHQVWRNMMEKVFGVTRQWAAEHPHTYRAVLLALMKACHWLESHQHSDLLYQWLSLPPYLDLEIEPLQSRGLFAQHLGQRFAGADTNFPWRSQGAWLLGQMREAGQWQGPLDNPVLDQVFNTALYREVADALGLNAPLADYRIEGQDGAGHSLSGTRGAMAPNENGFIDGLCFGLLHF
ncbi:ABC transporter substrate-binding protein [Marinobacterium sp. D7]|uniref:CmpA/NrtA family ABC transporter substrate-binding protein n=1 Tax=Marinobacterium ramblicola TaxID=2849041 RepID=UPI001C2DD39D|nr:CmpA/NrtA family ABC transporter substrate-binding protein [Marinobacterium ramblicola]MBV1786696.1 ABC transporter substrate-binding protein [Marinobacterium ramblicola]